MLRCVILSGSDKQGMFLFSSNERVSRLCLPCVEPGLQPCQSATLRQH